MHNEDFTTYAEVDEGFALTVISSKVTGVNIGSGDNTHVSKDFGADYFKNFFHTIEAEVTDPNWGSVNNKGIIWAITDTPGTIGSLLVSNDAVGAYFDFNTSKIVLHNFTNDTTRTSPVLNKDHLYYFEAARVGGSVRFYIFSAPGIQNLISLLRLPNNDDFRYVQVMSSVDDVGDPASYYVQNLNLAADDILGGNLMRTLRTQIKTKLFG